MLSEGLRATEVGWHAGLKRADRIMAHGGMDPHVYKDGGDHRRPGPSPIGYIAYSRDGRMMAAVFRRDRLPPRNDGWIEVEKAQLFDDMLAYVASYTLEGNRVVHHVEGSWNPNWQGDLSRPFTLEGDLLVISGAPGIDPATGEEVIYRMEFTKV